MASIAALAYNLATAAIGTAVSVGSAAVSAYGGKALVATGIAAGGKALIGSGGGSGSVPSLTVAGSAAPSTSPQIVPSLSVVGGVQSAYSSERARQQAASRRGGTMVRRGLLFSEPMLSTPTIWGGKTLLG